jgi:hypothetical protein
MNDTAVFQGTLMHQHGRLTLQRRSLVPTNAHDHPGFALRAARDAAFLNRHGGSHSTAAAGGMALELK